MKRQITLYIIPEEHNYEFQCIFELKISCIKQVIEFDSLLECALPLNNRKLSQNLYNIVHVSKKCNLLARLTCNLRDFILFPEILKLTAIQGSNSTLLKKGSLSQQKVVFVTSLYVHFNIHFNNGNKHLFSQTL